MNVLITGGLGFIGFHLVECLYKTTSYNIYIIDKLTNASKGFDKLRELNLLHNDRVHVFTFDMCNEFTSGLIYELGDINYIIHMAAETHVDNSISNPIETINNNISSTVNLLEYSRKLKNLIKFFCFSTDEVFGPAPQGTAYKEWDRHRPTNPYSASKSACESISLAYHNTFKIPIIIINSMNVFGERQYIEKFIPKIIKYILEEKELEIHADATCTSPGSRFYIHARNVCNALLFLIDNGIVGEKYNIVGEKEVDNLELALFISLVMDKELKYKLVNFHENRPGHDLRYCLDGTRMKELGWEIPVSFEQSLTKTVKWTMENLNWLNE